MKFFLILLLGAGFLLQGNDTLKENTIIDRKTGERFRESVMGDKALRFAYETLLGRSLWGILFNSSFLSDLMGKYYDSPASCKKIASLTAIPGCNAAEAEFPTGHYSSFNDFFARKLKAGSRPSDPAEDILSSPADGRLLVYSGLKATDPIPVKGAKKSLNDLCCEDLGAGSFAVAVVRLAPVDYHRFHFPCDCIQAKPPMTVRGKYHSVNPIALAKRPDLYVENTRQITELSSKIFGSFRYLEVGAFGVGSIIQTSSEGEHRKADEKGFFKFGGSTVILIFDAAKLQWDADLLKNSADGVETLIRCGETIGRSR